MNRAASRLTELGFDIFPVYFSLAGQLTPVCGQSIGQSPRVMPRREHAMHAATLWALIFQTGALLTGKLDCSIETIKST
jgi:hypothetical protein